MNHDSVFWSVVIGVAGSAAVVAWLLYMAYRNATKDKNEISSWLLQKGGEIYSPPFSYWARCLRINSLDNKRVDSEVSWLQSFRKSTNRNSRRVV